MKKINVILKVGVILVLLSFFVGCKADELPCKSVVLSEYELVQ